MEINWDDSHGEPSRITSWTVSSLWLKVQPPLLVSSYDWLACPRCLQQH